MIWGGIISTADKKRSKRLNFETVVEPTLGGTPHKIEEMVYSALPHGPGPVKSQSKMNNYAVLVGGNSGNTKNTTDGYNFANINSQIMELNVFAYGA